jgi:hypothetical protein
MNASREKMRRVGGLFLEALMLVFIFTCSWSDSTHNTQFHAEQIFTAIPIDQIAFRESDSSSETLLNFLSKFRVSDVDYLLTKRILIEISPLKTSSFFVSLSRYNSFYTHITASAP